MLQLCVHALFGLRLPSSKAIRDLYTLKLSTRFRLESRGAFDCSCAMATFAPRQHDSVQSVKHVVRLFFHFSLVRFYEHVAAGFHKVIFFHVS